MKHSVRKPVAQNASHAALRPVALTTATAPQPEARRALWQCVWPSAIALAALTALAAAIVLALWLASFFLFASLRLNPLHAGLGAWLDALLAWRDGQMPQGGRRLAGAAIFGLLIAVGAPMMVLYAAWNGSGRRRLHGSARFASEAEIRSAGLL